MKAKEAREQVHSPSHSDDEESREEYKPGAVYVAGFETKYLSPADMVLPLFCGVCINLFYMVLLIPIVVLFYNGESDLDECIDAQFDILLLSLFTVHACILLNDILAIYHSFTAKASGTNPCLNTLFNIRLILNAIEVLVVLYGVYCVFFNKSNDKCWDTSDGKPVHILTAFVLALNFSVLLGTWCCLCCCLSSSSASASPNTKPKDNRVKRFLSAGVFGEEASKLTSSFYGLGGLINILSHGTKYTPAEIITGLHLLRMLQKHYGKLTQNCDENKLHYQAVTDELLLKECEIYTLYANAAYGIPLYSMSSPCAICCAPPCCLPKNFDDPYSNEDIPDHDKLVLRTHKRMTGVQIDNSSFKVFLHRTHCEHPQNDVLLVAQVGGLHQVNFYVVVDHHQRTLVIAIRGTLSIGDTITDANTAPELCEDIQSDTPCYMHQGIANCAKDVFDKIMQSKAVLAFVTNEKYSTYDVVICGHSLGGGATVLLSVMMRYGQHQHLQHFLNDNRKFKAYAIAPPSCIDREFALKKQNELSEFLTCVILGHDLVPRLSFYGLITTRAAVTLLLSQLDKTTRGPWWVYRNAITTNKETILHALPEHCIYCNNVSTVQIDAEIDVKHDGDDDSVEDQTRVLLPKSSGESCFISDVREDTKKLKREYNEKLEKHWMETHSEEEDYKDSDLCKNNELLWNIRFCQAGKVIYVAKEERDAVDSNTNTCCQCIGNVGKFVCRSMICNVCQCRCCLDPKDTKYKAYMADADIFCDNMLFSKDMMPDHMPHLYLDALQKLLDLEQ